MSTATPWEAIPANRAVLIDEWATWIHHLANWSHAVTVTFKRHDAKGHAVSQVGLEQTLRHLIRLLNIACFKRKRVSKGWTVGVAAVVDWGPQGDHPHAHLLLEAPTDRSFEEFSALINQATGRTRLVARQMSISPYFSIGGARYLCKHGVDRMVLAVFSPPRTT